MKWSEVLNEAKMEQRDFVILEDSPVLCCSAILKAGHVVTLMGKFSKNTVMIKYLNNYHKMKYSALRRITGTTMEKRC